MTSELALLGDELTGRSSATAPPSPEAWGDWVGIVASIGCAVHCAAMPFVIAYLPALGLSFLADEGFHQWMAVACFLIALAAFVPGFRKHGRLAPVVVAGAGLVMISIAAFGFAGECCPSCESEQAAAEPAACTDASCELCAADEPEAAPPANPGAASAISVASVIEFPLGIAQVAPWLTPLGGLFLVSAHLLNRRYGCLCGCCSNRSTEGSLQ